jgi:dihydroorotase
MEFRNHLNTLIEGGRVIDPSQGIDRITNVYIQDGWILEVGDEAPKGFDIERRIDASGMVVCPGLVDLQARMREPGQEYIATIASETRAATKGGITTLICPPDTDPIIDNKAAAELVINRAKAADVGRLFPTGALTKRLRGELISEMKDLKEAGCVAMSNADKPILDTAILRRALEYAATVEVPVILNAMEPYLAKDGCAHEGEISDRLGLSGIPEEAETIALSRDLMLIEDTGVRAHFAQISCARSVEMIRQAQARGLPVTCDVTAHQLFLTEYDLTEFDSNMHLIPPLRTARDRDALRAGLADGTIGAVVSDHQPWEEDDKAMPFPETKPGASGVETLLALTLRLVEDGLLSLPEALAKVTNQAADLLNLPGGTLKRGRKGDVCIFDPEAYWEVKADELWSMGKNSPFIGWNFKGKVIYTLKSGQIVYYADQISA